MSSILYISTMAEVQISDEKDESKLMTVNH